MVSGESWTGCDTGKREPILGDKQSVKRVRCKRFLLAQSARAAGPGLSEFGARCVAGAGDEVVVYHAALDVDEATPANRFEERNLPGKHR